MRLINIDDTLISAENMHKFLKYKILSLKSEPSNLNQRTTDVLTV
jgi:hypothetical protein